MMRNRSRLLTIEAVALLPIARFMVDVVPLKYWRGSLGAIVSKSLLADPLAISPTADEYPGGLARHVERAAAILPLHTKCLPRAVTLQWMLGRRGMSALLVIAVQKGANNSTDHYHAWVETSGEMLIGHCDRSLYNPLMVISNAPAALAGRR